MSAASVKTFLDDVATRIAKAEALLADAQSKATDAKVQLEEIATEYADEIAEVNGYTPTGSFETLAKDEAGKLTTEYNAVISRANTIIAT